MKTTQFNTTYIFSLIAALLISGVSYAMEKENNSLYRSLSRDEKKGKVVELGKAVSTNYIEAVRTLLDQGVPCDIRRRRDRATPLMIAACRGYKEIVQELVLHKADVNAYTRQGFTPLMKAAAKGHGTVVETLIHQKGVDLDKRDHMRKWTALMWAARAREEGIMNILEEAGADPALRAHRPYGTQVFEAKKPGLTAHDILMEYHYKTKCEQ